MPLTIPPTLAQYRQFILYIVVPSVTRPGKLDKFPIHPVTGRKYDAHDPTIWMSAAEALAAVATDPSKGVGFVFTEYDDLFFIDIDDGLHDGRWATLALQLCEFLNGCYVETSISGKGLHIIGRGVAAPHCCTMKTPDVHIDLYTEKRFCALTGTDSYGDPCYSAQYQLDWLTTNYFPPKQFTAIDSADWTTEPCAEFTGSQDDDELIRRMLNSRSATGAFSGRASVADLWAGNVEVLSVAYPSDTDNSRMEYGYDHSIADAALCQHLAFWTGRDCERMDRLFRRSALYREKWERTGYARPTILKATANCKAVYSVAPSTDTALQLEPATSTEPDAVTGIREGFQILTCATQLEYFKGCVYIRDTHCAFVPDGAMLKPDQFSTFFGGRVFAMDTINGKTTCNAWEAFTQSQGFSFPQAHTGCFRPECQSGAMIEEEGRVVVNTYVSIKTRRVKGDPSRFTAHLAKMLPNKQDQEILLAYMASLVQNPGKKFQWCPLIQGMEGNGKSLLIRVLEHAVGHRYSHLPNAKDIDSKFNAWIANKLFIGVEEIYTADRQDKIDALKPLITNDRCELQGKGDNQITGDNRANFVMCSNHKDAIRKTLSDRRYCVFYTAQQEPGDLQRDGMTGDYFPDLYDWLRADGYAIVNEFLQTYEIPAALNPATHLQVAPATSSTGEAISASMGGIEQEIMEAIGEGRTGFCGGWVSSFAFDRLLAERRAGSKIPPNKRRDIMKGLGYDWHPALSDGRVHNPITDCGETGRPRLYVKMNSPQAELKSGSVVVRTYQEAQAGGTVASAAFGG